VLQGVPRDALAAGSALRRALTFAHGETQLLTQYADDAEAAAAAMSMRARCAGPDALPSELMR
jgi:hypothetical protein